MPTKRRDLRDFVRNEIGYDYTATAAYELIKAEEEQTTSRTLMAYHIAGKCITSSVRMIHKTKNFRSDREGGFPPRQLTNANRTSPRRSSDPIGAWDIDAQGTSYFAFHSTSIVSLTRCWRGDLPREPSHRNFHDPNSNLDLKVLFQNRLRETSE